MDCDAYIYLSLTIYLWQTTFGKGASASVQETLKHMLILRVFMVSKDTLAMQGEAQGRRRGETKNYWAKTQSSWTAVGLQV